MPAGNLKIISEVLISRYWVIPEIIIISGNFRENSKSSDKKYNI